MRPTHRRLSRAYFKHLHIRILLPPSQMSKERRTSSPAIHALLLHHSLIQHLISQTFDSVSSQHFWEKKTATSTNSSECTSLHFKIFMEGIPFQPCLQFMGNSGMKKQRDPEVLLNFSNCLRKELGWEIHIKDITLETNVQRDLVIDVSLGILTYWKRGLWVYRDKIRAWMLFSLDAFRNSLGLSW